MALNKDGALLRINAACDIHSDGLEGIICEFLPIVGNGNGVHVYDKEEIVVGVLIASPLAHGTEVVAEMQSSCGLDTGQDTLLSFSCR